MKPHTFRKVIVLSEEEWLPIYRAAKRAGVDPREYIKLRAGASIVDRYDTTEIDHTLAWVKEICAVRGITFADDEALIHACDYHNQYGMQARPSTLYSSTC